MKNYYHNDTHDIAIYIYIKKCCLIGEQKSNDEKKSQQ